MAELNPPQIAVIKVNPKSRSHSYKISGNVFDLYSHARIGVKSNTKLYKRYFVSPEFIQLFFLISDDKFDDALFERLSEKEKREFAHVISFLNINSRAFTIALSKLNRGMFSRMQMIEGAIKAGNLNEELRDEYIEIIQSMKHLGMLPTRTAGRYISSIKRTYDAIKKSN